MLLARKTKKFRYRMPVLLTDEKLRELTDRLREFCTETIFTVETKDDDSGKFRFVSSEALLSFDNAKRNAIVKLMITCSGEVPEKMLLEFGPQPVLKCTYQMDKSEEACFLQMLKDFLGSARTQYGLINLLVKANYVIVMAGMIVTLWGKSFFGLGTFEHFYVALRQTEKIYLLQYFIVSFLYMILVKLVFKHVVFYWGGGIRTYERFRSLRRELPWVIVLGASFLVFLYAVIVTAIQLI